MQMIEQGLAVARSSCVAFRHHLFAFAGRGQFGALVRHFFLSAGLLSQVAGQDFPPGSKRGHFSTLAPEAVPVWL